VIAVVVIAVYGGIVVAGDGPDARRVLAVLRPGRSGVSGTTDRTTEGEDGA